MKMEIAALEENNTWSLMKLPLEKKAIDSNCVYKIKYKPNGEVERYQASLVAKGTFKKHVIDKLQEICIENSRRLSLRLVSDISSSIIQCLRLRSMSLTLLLSFMSMTFFNGT